MPKKNIVLYIGPITPAIVKAKKELEKRKKQKFRLAILMSKVAKIADKSLLNEVDFLYRVDIKNDYHVDKALMEIKDKVVLVSCRQAFYMPLYGRIVSLFPHLVMPTKESIEWCSNKLMMRRKFRRYFPEITPKYSVAHGYGKDEVKAIMKHVGFPCIVKPASLAASRLVSLCYHEEELVANLRKTFRGLKSAYKNTGALVEPEIIVEQYMEGEMYSVDGYVDHIGHLKSLAPVNYKTGQSVGIDDFFTYRHILPTKLSEESVKACHDVGAKGVKALGLRAVPVHMEFVKLEEGWKLVEIDARIGGHRDLLYREVYGIPHGLNELLTRMGEKPVIKKKVLQHAASFNFFPHKKGVIKSIKGLKKVRELESLRELIMVKKVGDKAGLAKQGYKKVLDITLVNASREKLLADIRRMEQAIKIEN
jgi:biotin carboxylase